MRANEAGRVGMDDAFALGDGAVFGGFLDHHRNVVADDFGQAGGVDGDDLRVVDGEDVGERLDELAMPPNTEAPSVKELVVATTGSLKWRVSWLR